MSPIFDRNIVWSAAPLLQGVCLVFNFLGAIKQSGMFAPSGRYFLRRVSIKGGESYDSYEGVL